MGTNKIFAQLTSEFVGTFMLVWTVSINQLGDNGNFNALSIALVYAIFTYGLGGISGAHFNPAVTAAALTAGKIAAPEAAQYIVVQLFGGVVAGLAMFFFNGTFAGPIMPQQRVGEAPGLFYSPVQACTVEFFYTFLIAFVVLNTAGYTKAAGNQYYGLAIGFCIAAGGYGGGPISGAAFNPAVAIGLGPFQNGWAYAYSVVELVAGVFAALVFKLLRQDDDEDNSEWTPTVPIKLLSEFIGTFYLCLTVALNVYTGSPGAAVSIASSYMCVIYALGSVSGAHFNPSVTVAVLASARDLISAAHALEYVLVQFAGGICGTLVGLFCANPSRPLGHLGPPPGSVDRAGRSIGLTDCADEEFIFTFGISFTVLCVATVRKPLSHVFGFCIGMCVAVGAVATRYSGAALNPAVTLGLETSNAVGNSRMAAGCGAEGCFSFGAVGMYFFFELLAGLFAALVFRFTHAEEYEPVSEKASLIDEQA
jgi:aquaporin Z